MSQMSLDPVKNFLLENSSPCDRWEELTEAQLTNFTKDGQFGGSSDPFGDAPAPGKVLELKKTHMMVDVSLKCFPNIHLGISHA